MHISRLVERVTLGEAGGKGLNLHLLTMAGFNVPSGFIIHTSAYNDYVDGNGLWDVIRGSLDDIDGVDSIRSASQRIREAFSKGTIPQGIIEEITDAYRGYGKVAVRSSATAEDLPDLSFAGQQDTFLNVEGDEQLLKAVVDCWSSLWTPRAIGYRDKNRVPQDEVSLAVIVQDMVQSEASGVMFTANPLTGVRSESVINATFGLGDLLVSGKIEPDEYRVDRITCEIRSKRIGAKNNGSGRQALTDEQIKSLTEIGSRIHGYYESPQDVEWAITDGVIHVLQSRPVTGLFPVLERVPVSPHRVYGSFGHVQGVLQPITPMGRDFLRVMIGTVQNRFGGHFTLKENLFTTSAGGRLYFNVTQMVENKRYHGMLKAALGYVEPGTLPTLESIMGDPRIEKIDSLPSLGSLFTAARGLGPVVLRVIATVLRPVRSRENMNQRNKTELSSLRNTQGELETIEEHIGFFKGLFKKMPDDLLKTLMPRVIAGMAMFFQLKMRAESLGLNNDALNISRGLPNNVTTEMALELWDTVQRIRQDEESRGALTEDASELVKAYRDRRLPPVFISELDAFIAKYGMRGVAEVDIGSTRWCDDPSHIIQLMQTYYKIDDPEKAPDATFKMMAKSAEASLERIEEEAGRQKGWLNKKLIGFLGYRQRNLAGLRETPKFYIVNILFIARNSLLEIGRQLTAGGILEDAWDIFYLHMEELDELQTKNEDWKLLVAERKKQQIMDSQKNPPRAILSDGHAFYGTVSSDGKTLLGSPVSPGTVMGAAHIILDPYGETLEPGEILVCPGTDPAWTPLFLAAGGLVMEVGGLMTHGSIVAREYGIPAVVGVSEATTRLKTGQKIIVDGENGVVTILE